ncbi:MAG: SRPBCC family protein [Candidatus Eremiobacteraeota bacterium]|nr:SRPBCC family protein [Candidatus Eremiobacteraeota bacterium]
MHLASTIDIAAPVREVYALAQDVGRWPRMLPHYRYVRILAQAGNQRRLEMAARRDWIPVRWQAVQRLDPLTPAMEFTHLAGWTTGMEVAWIFAATPAGTNVTVTHELDVRRFPLLGDWIGRRLIGTFFVETIAGRTLERMKQLAEGARVG